MPSLNEFAQNELDLILKSCEGTKQYHMQKLMNKDIMEVINIFCSQGHTGFTADYTLNIIERLLRYLPILPLTGDDEEWEKLDFDEKICYQNKRCPAVFKDANGRAYYTEAKIFSTDNGRTWFRNKDSSEFIEFPFEVPKYSESIIIDNKEKRLQIFGVILDFINNIGLEIDLNNIDEVTDLTEILNKDQILSLQNYLKDYYDITDNIFDLSEKQYFWQVINIVLDCISDK